MSESDRWTRGVPRRSGPLGLSRVLQDVLVSRLDDVACLDSGLVGLMVTDGLKHPLVCAECACAGSSKWCMRPSV
jgi:hypothetical protein